MYGYVFCCVWAYYILIGDNDMKYLFQICDAREELDSKTGKRPAVGEFIMDAISESDALNNYYIYGAYHKVMSEIPDDVKKNMIFHVENEYVKNMDVTAKINMTTGFDLTSEDLKSIHGCGLILTSNDSDMICHRGKNYLECNDFTITQTGPRSFEANVSLYGRQNTDSVMRIPEYECVNTIPVYKVPDTFTASIENMSITVIDKNLEKAKEMEAFGEPAYIDKDGHSVYEITFDKELIKDPRFVVVNEETDDFTQAVSHISTKDASQSL